MVLVTGKFNGINFNGLLDPSAGVRSNMAEMMKSGQFFTRYNKKLGKFDVVISQPHKSTFTFDDDRIIGKISVPSTSSQTFYNSVRVKWPDREIRDKETTSSMTFLTTSGIGMKFLTFLRCLPGCSMSNHKSGHSRGDLFNNSDLRR